MNLKYFTEEKYDELLYGISKNEEKYRKRDGWTDAYFADEKCFHESLNWNVEDFEPVFTPGKKTAEQKSEEDLANVQRLYDAYKGLSPQQATNKYMWTYLCHADSECREYIRDRWSISEGDKKQIRKHYFVVSGKDYESSLLRDNALSRLWWFGYLTYDDNNPSDPYALTKILLMNQTVCNDVMYTANRMNPKRMQGVLRALNDFYAKLDNKSKFDKKYERPCIRYLNRYAAATNLDYLEMEEIYQLAFDYMVDLQEKAES